jgi:hypothetical protein
LLAEFISSICRQRVRASDDPFPKEQRPEQKRTSIPISSEVHQGERERASMSMHGPTLLAHTTRTNHHSRTTRLGRARVIRGQTGHPGQPPTSLASAAVAVFCASVRDAPMSRTTQSTSQWGRPFDRLSTRATRQKNPCISAATLRRPSCEQLIASPYV